MDKQIFREYDIRGKVGSEFDLTQVYALARAIAVHILHKSPDAKKIVVAMDGRAHSLQIKKSLCRALIDSGFDVIFIGVCPTPVMYFSLHQLKVDAGIMITASHNGPEYNGLKMNLGTTSIWGADIQKIRVLYEQRVVVENVRSRGHEIEHSMIDRYVDWLANHFSHLQGSDYSMVFDCANGAAGAVVPQLIEKMNWKCAELLYPEVDGTFPNHEANPVVEKNARDLCNAVAAVEADIGFGFDGDADRMAPVTAEGRLIAGDQLLVLYARSVLDTHPHASIIYDIKCSQIVPDLVARACGTAHVSPSGHSIIKAAIQKHHAALAGELSCHFFFADRYFGYDDGIYAALRLLEIVQESHKTLDELVSELPETFATSEMRFLCAERVKENVVSGAQHYFSQKKIRDISLVDGVRVSTDDGWGIVRASNTQSVICVRCESSTPEGLNRVKKDFYAALVPFFEKDFLNEKMEL